MKGNALEPRESPRRPLKPRDYEREYQVGIIILGVIAVMALAGFAVICWAIIEVVQHFT